MKQLSHFFIYSGAFLLILLVFQNCAAPISTGDELASVAKVAPFAFDAKIDTVAHLSCNYTGTLNQGSHFTFKVGAYRSGSGLRYTDAFVSSTGGYTPDKRAQVLANDSGQNANLSFVAGLTYRDDLSLPNVALAGAFTPVLSSSAVALSLPQYVGNTSRVNIFNGQNLGTSFYIPPQYVQNFRLNSQASDAPGAELILAQYYSKDGDSVAAGDGAPRGLALYTDFLAPSHIDATSKQDPMNQTILSGITEKVLNNREGPVTGNWTCTNYLIVRNNEQSFYNQDYVSTSQAAFNELRQILPQQDWTIVLDHPSYPAGYIMPKTISCYGNNTNVAANVPNYPGKSFAGACTNGSNTCPQYLSVCKRN